MVSEEKIEKISKFSRNPSNVSGYRNLGPHYELSNIAEDLHQFFPHWRPAELRRLCAAVFWLITEAAVAGIPTRIHRFGRFEKLEKNINNTLFDFRRGTVLPAQPHKRLQMKFRPSRALKAILNPIDGEYMSLFCKTWTPEAIQKIKDKHAKCGEVLFQDAYDKFGNYTGYTDEYAEALSEGTIP